MFSWILACADPDPPLRQGHVGPIEAPSGNQLHLVRLTHRQWERTVVDLLSLPGPTGLSDAFLPDPAMSRFDTDAEAMWVEPAQWQLYQSAAEALAHRVVEEDAVYRAVVPQDLRPGGLGPGRTERDLWLASFLSRAFRRPVEHAEVTRYGALFAAAPTDAEPDAFRAGVLITVAAALQSPDFLYRTEGVLGAEGRLAGPELAARLSYALWDTMPDDALTNAAADGLTDDEVQAEVARMLADPRAHDVIAELHRQWLHVDGYQAIWRPSEEVLGIDVFEGSTPASMQREVYAFVDDVVFGGGTVRDLLTSNRTFVDERLAPLYGLEGVRGTRLREVTLDPTQRAGLLTLSGFLAWQADRDEPSLIRRGGFVADSIACIDLPSPPPGVPPLPPPDGATTQRQRIEQATGTCGGACHASLINPLGFPFGHYDGNAEWRSSEAGQPIDATGTYLFEDGTQSYDGAVELAHVLAERPQVHRCFADHLLAYLEGRPTSADDDERVAALAAESMAGGSVLDLVTDIVTAGSFRATRP